MTTQQSSTTGDFNSVWVRGMTRFLVCCSLAFASSFAAMADEIVQQRGSLFSVYTPSSCSKAEQAKFSLVLHCTFERKLVRFYLKEFPGQLSERFDARKNPPSGVVDYVTGAFRSIVDELDPNMGQGLKFFSSGGATGDDIDPQKYWGERYISSDNVPAHLGSTAQCVFVRILAYRLGVSAVLVSFSENDGLQREGRIKCLGIPGDVQVILGSLGRISEGFRFKNSY
jgi:hypothetical protein